jgi:hypothetical protein
MRTAVEVVPQIGRETGAAGAAYRWRCNLRPPPVLCFALDRIPLDRLASDLVRVTHPDGAIWLVVWKKGCVPLGASSWEEAQEAMLEAGWVDNKVLSLGAEVYASHYVRRRGKREL